MSNTNISLIRSFNPALKPNELLNYRSKYHYTSPNALLSILTTGCLRFTDARYMNDTSETLYFLKLLLEFIEKNKERYPLSLECINALLTKNSFEDIKSLKVSNINYDLTFMNKKDAPYIPKRVFVFCTSSDSDSLNMWNYYVHNGNYQGYNIGINMNKLLKTFHSIGLDKIGKIKISHGNVLYNLKEQNFEIELFLNSTESALREHYNLFNNENDESQNQIHNSFIAYGEMIIYQYIENSAAFFKHTKFSGENEFRIVVEIREDLIPYNKETAKEFFGESYENMYLNFCVKNGLLVPYLQVPLVKDAIQQITISPITEYEIAKSSIEEVLDINGYKNVNVKKSDIPIRF